MHTKSIPCNTVLKVLYRTHYPSSSSWLRPLSWICSMHACTAYNIMGSIHAPLSSILTASAMYGTNSRFTINLGVSCSGSRVHTSSTLNSKCFTYCLASVVLSLVHRPPLGGRGLRTRLLQFSKLHNNEYKAAHLNMSDQARVTKSVIGHHGN